VAAERFNVVVKARGLSPAGKRRKAKVGLCVVLAAMSRSWPAPGRTDAQRNCRSRLKQKDVQLICENQKSVLYLWLAADRMRTLRSAVDREEGQRGFLAFFRGNPLESPNSDEQNQAKPSLFAWIGLAGLDVLAAGRRRTGSLATTGHLVTTR
jgi:hypothetical protein